MILFCFVVEVVLAQVITAQGQTKTYENEPDAHSDEKTCSQNKVWSFFVSILLVFISFLVVIVLDSV